MNKIKKCILAAALLTSTFCHALTSEQIRHWADCEIEIVCYEIQEIESVCQYQIDDVAIKLAYKYGKLSVLYNIMALTEDPKYLIGVGE